MRSRILTDLERQMLNEFLTKGTKREGFRVLQHRMRKNVTQLKSDLDLILKALEKMEA